MKSLPIKTLCRTALCGIAFVTDAAAHNPTGRRRTGIIENVDPSAPQLAFRADLDGKSSVFVWNNRTRFVRDVSFVDSSAVRKGARVDVICHTPFFGEPFVCRVFLHDSAPADRSGK